MSNFANQVLTIAAEAARLARMLSPQRDVLAEVLRQLKVADVAVTHCGHAAFKAADVGFSGADGFEVEDGVVRIAGQTIIIEPEQRLRWFALFTNLARGRDAILNAAITTEATSTLTGFIRCRFMNGKHLDGPRVALGTGRTVDDHYIPHPVVSDDEEFSSQLFVTIDAFTGATVGALGVTTISPT